MKARVALAALWLLAFSLAGCGSDLTIGGNIPPTVTAAPVTPSIGPCFGTGSGCNVSSDCCSGVCFLNRCN